ncbi:MAG TPA: alpha-hydroxy acid oxidase [Ktedonobacterales bacterium]|jgi:4-hydroxymandelate oxidase|nr:alpha-hydroxy acid oxidase [Ktedonobacterales bacterium]
MEPINLFDYEPLARERIDPVAWDYYQSGANDEVTLRENRFAFERIRLRPRVLVSVEARDTRLTLLGESLRSPIVVAPMAYQRMAHDEGEAAMARGVGAAGMAMCVSTMSTISLEDVAQAASGPLWFQLYVYRDRSVTESLVRRAEQAGYRALVVTVDMPAVGQREADLRNGFGLPPHLTLANFEGALAEEGRVAPGESALSIYASHQLDPNLTWEGIDWLRSITSLPVLLKGILTAEDAALAVAHGVAGVIVSNHGGRQLDGVAPTIEALPEVAQAVAGRCVILMDGGVRRGTDILKALALGAQAVLVGRPILWALAVDGAAGVERALTLLHDELQLAMALAGRPTLASIDRSLVRLP